MAASQPFGVIPTGCSIITTPSSVPSETSFIFNLPPKPFSHIVVFLLPGIVLPPDTAAAVYLSLGGNYSDTGLSFKFLGGFGPGKESAIFKVNGAKNDPSSATNTNEEVDMDAPEGLGSDDVGREMVLGISVESASSVSAQLSLLAAGRSASRINEPSNALIVARRPQPSTLQLAQKIINNAFNFLASFSGNIPVSGGVGTAGVEVVPLKAFEDWWRKFESRLRSDPQFLERNID